MPLALAPEIPLCSRFNRSYFHIGKDKFVFLFVFDFDSAMSERIRWG